MSDEQSGTATRRLPANAAPLVLGASWGRAVPLGLLSLGMALAGPVAVVISPGPAGWVIGTLDFMLFGWAALFSLGKGIRRVPVLIIDRNGIDDRSTIAAAGPIGWNEIGTLAVRGRGTMLQVVPNTMAVIDRQPVLKRIYMRCNAALLGAPIVISLYLVSTADRWAMVEYLDRYMPSIAQP